MLHLTSSVTAFSKIRPLNTDKKQFGESIRKLVHNKTLFCHNVKKIDVRKCFNDETENVLTPSMAFSINRWY
ncbi:hypothetical protein GJ496_002394 [Pomphorhynchus laevis]|nr:hypothetical protein GJ496_002394 [Pomphorhynchus laevis]